MARPFDIVIANGEVFDGLGNPRRSAHIGIRDGRVEVISDVPLTGAGETIDAAGCWVTPRDDSW